jgi:hypothetical protein
MTLLPELERILSEAVYRDERASAPADGQRRWARFAGVLSPGPARRGVARWAAFVAIAVAIVAGAALATRDQDAPAGGYDRAPETHYAESGRHASPAGARPAEGVVARFGVLGLAQTAADELGDRSQGGLAGHFYADQTHLGAKLTPLAGTARAAASDIYVAGGLGDTVCVLILPVGASGPTGECLAPQIAEAGRLVMTLGHGGQEVEIAGVVPDGVDEATATLASGQRVELPVRGNLYSAVLPGPTATVSFHAGDRTVTVDTPS